MTIVKRSLISQIVSRHPVVNMYALLLNTIPKLWWLPLSARIFCEFLMECRRNSFCWAFLSCSAARLTMSSPYFFIRSLCCGVGNGGPSIVLINLPSFSILMWSLQNKGSRRHCWHKIKVIYKANEKVRQIAESWELLSAFLPYDAFIWREFFKHWFFRILKLLLTWSNAHQG